MFTSGGVKELGRGKKEEGRGKSEESKKRGLPSDYSYIQQIESNYKADKVKILK